jgi:hypothetical protein
MPGWHAEIFLRGLSQVELPPLPAAAIRPAANSRGDNGHARRGPEPPPYLRRLLQSGGSDLPGEQAAADGAQQPQVPVILAVAPGSQAVAVNASSGRIIDAAGVNTTRCIRYADGYTPGASGGARPLLDLSGCLASTTVVATRIQTLLVEVRFVFSAASCWPWEEEWSPRWQARATALPKLHPVCQAGACSCCSRHQPRWQAGAHSRSLAPLLLNRLHPAAAAGARECAGGHPDGVRYSSGWLRGAARAAAIPGGAVSGL